MINIYFKKIRDILTLIKPGESISLSDLTNQMGKSMDIRKIFNELNIMARKGYISIDNDSNLILTPLGSKLFAIDKCSI